MIPEKEEYKVMWRVPIYHLEERHEILTTAKRIFIKGKEGSVLAPLITSVITGALQSSSYLMLFLYLNSNCSFSIRIYTF